MKLRSAVLLSLTAACRLGAAAPTIPVEQRRDLSTLIRELSDENYRVREQASRDIWRMGDAALPALQAAAESPDPEQAYRARELVGKLQLHITPDTDPLVIGLVERYLKAPPGDKPALLGKMKRMGAWRQMLKLYAAETDGALREKLQPTVAGVAVRGARERLTAGDAEGAREFLELAPADQEGLLALAEFHRSQGTLAAEWERAKIGKGPKAAAWQLALQRAAGNLSAAKAAAEAAGDTRVAAAMAALAGDPLPWLQQVSEQRQADPVVGIYSAVAAKRWQGRQLRNTELEPLTKLQAARNITDRAAAMHALFLLGESELAEPVFVKHSPLAAFQYFDALERSDEALKALGLDPVRPAYQPWIEKRIARLHDIDVAEQHEAATDGEELLGLASFLERHGLHDQAVAAFARPLSTMAAQDANKFQDFLGRLFDVREANMGAPRLATHLGLAWAGDDDARWDDLVRTACGDDDETLAWWNWLAELDPKVNRSARFAGMLALHGLGPDPDGLRAKWLQWAWQAVEKAPAGQRSDLAARIFTLVAETGDADASLRAWDLLSEEARKEEFWGQYIVLLSAAGRWNEAATVIIQQLDQLAAAKQEPSAELHAYAASALRRAGRADEAVAHDFLVDQLALGDAKIALKIGGGYAFGADYERADAWWARAARQADPGSSEFLLALMQGMDRLLEDGRWGEAAGQAEIIARLHLATDYSLGSPVLLLRQRLQADMARALANLANRRDESLALLEKCHHMFATDGSLADYFFPALRKAGLVKEHDIWFQTTWDQMQQIIARYPEADNSCNTAAWFAARAVRNLDAAEKLLGKALATNPRQPAYLDTMAEIQFAAGRRENALKWSKIAVNAGPADPQLRRQQERFRSGPLPK